MPGQIQMPEPRPLRPLRKDHLCRYCKIENPKAFRGKDKSMCRYCKSAKAMIESGNPVNTDPNIIRYCYGGGYDISLIPSEKPEGSNMILAAPNRPSLVKSNNIRAQLRDLTAAVDFLLRNMTLSEPGDKNLQDEFKAHKEILSKHQYQSEREVKENVSVKVGEVSSNTLPQSSSISQYGFPVTTYSGPSSILPSSTLPVSITKPVNLTSSLHIAGGLAQSNNTLLSSTAPQSSPMPQYGLPGTIQSKVPPTLPSNFLSTTTTQPVNLTSPLYIPGGLAQLNNTLASSTIPYNDPMPQLKLGATGYTRAPPILPSSPLSTSTIKSSNLAASSSSIGKLAQLNNTLPKTTIINLYIPPTNRVPPSTLPID